MVINGSSSALWLLTVGVPQGSLTGPGEFPTYSLPLFHIAHKHGITIHMYADDTQLFLSFTPCEYAEAKSMLEAYLSEMKDRKAMNHLTLNQ